MLIRQIVTTGLILFVLAHREARPAPPELTVKKAQIVNSRNEPVRLRGVNAASLEWTSDGLVSEKADRRNPAKTYQAVGMQALLDTVRATGAKNLVIVGGLDWAYDMSGFLEGSSSPIPTGNGVIYANHAYPFKGDTVERWLAKMEKAAKDLPIIVSEFGSDAERRARPDGRAMGARRCCRSWKTTGGAGPPGTCTPGAALG